MNRPLSHFRSAPRERKHAVRLGIALRQLRTARGDTVQLVALGASIAHGFLTQLELGYCEPSLATLRALAGAFGMKPSAILALAESLAPEVDRV